MNEMDEKAGIITMDITFFIRQGEYFRRERERHSLRMWSAGEISEALMKTGYELKGTYAAFTHDAPAPGCERIQFVAAAV
jgi:hypothetical protein